MTRSQKLFDALLAKLQNDLAPGAADQLRRRFLGSGGPQRSPGEVATELIGFLIGHKESARYFRPGRAFANEGETPLQAICRRWPLADPSTAKALAEDLHFELGHKPAGEIAAALTARFEKRSEWHRLDESIRPRPPIGEAKVRAALTWFGGDIRRDAVDSLVQEWGARYGHLRPSAILKKVAEMLTVAHVAETVTADGKPIKMDHANPVYHSKGATAYDAEFMANSAETSDGPSAQLANQANARMVGIGL